ncbi:acyl-CoA N-acyltransferase [Gigaspora margarita]|uniref:Acyl-CoA N-acyltransferase n=1 Tax=Gigaspora margarita TaxID=4874 RepID=A0A8H3X9G1_GIGMA|nr:acyl-CoA N-acyltransferase [Gigaspora margarita]
MDHNSFVNSLTFKNVNESDVERAFQLELEGFPPEEAFTIERYRYIQSVAPDLFLGAYSSDSSSTSFSKLLLIGTIMSTLADAPKFTKESMSSHNPFGKTVCIHTVCVDKQYRGRGIALCMLKEYIKRLKNETQNKDADGKYERVALICHEYLIPLYQKAGFTSMGESEIIYGRLFICFFIFIVAMLNCNSYL